MVASEEGFFFPSVDGSRCVDCKACGTVCPVLNPPEKHLPRKAFAAWALDESVRSTSSSGGVYSVMGEHVLEHGGAVSGCRFDGELALKHELYERPGDTIRFRGSKYVQCFPNGIYRKIKQELANGRTVLFTGTPCQTAALRNYLGRPCEKLIICDLVCHGVPSQKIFRSYLERHQQSPDPDRSVIAFRDLKGWGDYYIRILERDTLQWRSDDATNEFIRAFLSGYCSNEACYSCPYACMERTGDLTLADFWGLGKEIPFDGDPSRGCSLILVNTEKGETMLQAVRDKLFLAERTPEEARTGNGQLRAPIARQPMRDVFYQMDWAEIAPKINYGKPSPLRKLLRACKRTVKTLLNSGNGK
jgi:coenzyme F420-reducing hydrogenase beta subunit